MKMDRAVGIRMKTRYPSFGGRVVGWLGWSFFLFFVFDWTFVYLTFWDWWIYLVQYLWGANLWFFFGFFFPL
jgi:hypothetical protein